jgi:hypothetical protein
MDGNRAAAGRGNSAPIPAPSERALKIGRERDCERGRADAETRRGRLCERNLQPRSNDASRPAPPQDRPGYFQNTLLDPHPAIPDQFTHLSNPAPEIPFFDRGLRLFAENRHKCLSINNLRTKSGFSQSTPIKANQAQSCLIAPFIKPHCPRNPSLRYLTNPVRITPSAKGSTKAWFITKDENMSNGKIAKPAPSLLDASKKWTKVAEEEGSLMIFGSRLPGVQAPYRPVLSNSVKVRQTSSRRKTGFDRQTPAWLRNIATPPQMLRESRYKLAYLIMVHLEISRAAPVHESCELRPSSRLLRKYF